MTHKKKYRAFRVRVDQWIARFGTVFAWVWLVFWALMGVTGVGMWVFGQTEDATERILPYFFLGLAGLHWLLVRAFRYTRDLILDFDVSCAVRAHESDNSVSAIAKALKISDQEAMDRLQRMCRRGYFSAYVDRAKQQLVFYTPPTPQAPQGVFCPGCGARSAITRHGEPCPYCGAPLAIETPKAGFSGKDSINEEK